MIKKSVQNTKSGIFKRVLSILWYGLCSLAIFYLVKSAIVGILVAIDPNDGCAVGMKFDSLEDGIPSCMANMFSMYLVALLCGMLTFVAFIFRNVKSTKNTKKKTNK